MQTVNYSTLRNNLKSYCDRAVEENETFIVTRREHQDVVLMSLDKYNNLMRISRSAAYLEGVRQVMARKDAGEVSEKELDILAGLSGLSLE